MVRPQPVVPEAAQQNAIPANGNGEEAHADPEESEEEIDLNGLCDEPSNAGQLFLLRACYTRGIKPQTRPP